MIYITRRDSASKNRH